MLPKYEKEPWGSFQNIQEARLYDNFNAWQVVRLGRADARRPTLTLERENNETL